MLDTFIHYVSRVLEVMFFMGVFGCVLAVLVSWVEIFGDGFTNH
jgi:hypothetical protein